MKGEGNDLEVVVFLARSHIGSFLTVNELLNKGVKIKAIVKSNNYVGKSKIKSIIKCSKVMGIRRSAIYLSAVIYMKLKIAYSALVNLLTGRKQRIINYKQIKRKYGIPIIKTKNVNSLETFKKIKLLNPDLILVCYFNQILKKDLIDLPKLGCFNIHPSIIQKYRGLSNYFWVLANNEKVTGVTLHKIDEGIDTGKIVAQKEVNIEDDDTEYGLLIKLSKEGVDLFLNSLGKIKRGESYTNDISQSVYCSLPTKEAYKRFLKLGRKEFVIDDFRGLF